MRSAPDSPPQSEHDDGEADRVGEQRPDACVLRQRPGDPGKERHAENAQADEEAYSAGYHAAGNDIRHQRDRGGIDGSQAEAGQAESNGTGNDAGNEPDHQDAKHDTAHAGVHQP